MLVHRMVKKVKDSKVWAKINTRDGGPGSGIKGHTTAEEPTQARPAAKAEEPAKSGEGKSFVSKEHAQAYINGAAKTASKLLGAGVKQGYTGFEWSKKGGYADAKMKLTRMKIEKAGFKKVDFDQADHPAGNWTRNTTIFQNENGDVIKMTSLYGETSRQNSHSVAYTPKDFNKAKERLYAQDSDPRGYKVSDQIIKGFLIYKSGKGPATYFAKNENGKEYEGTMEQIKKQIDDYWAKQDEDVMKQKVRDSKTKDAFQGVATAKPGKYFSGYNKQEKSPLFDNEKDAKEWCAFRMQRQDAKHISKCEVVKTSDSKTKDKAYHPRWRIKDDKLFRLRSAIKKVKRVKDVELSNRAVWRKEDFDKMVAAGNFTIVSKQPWGYEVKVKSGNIYGVEIKDTYTKGSADKKTKDATIEFYDFNKWKEFCISKGYRVVKTDKYNTLAHTEGKLMGGFHSRANSGWVEPSVQSARYSYGSKDSKDEAVQMQCNECGKRFKKNITSSTVEVQCPACGGYDTDVDEPAGKVITQR